MSKLGASFISCICSPVKSKVKLLHGANIYICASSPIIKTSTASSGRLVRIIREIQQLFPENVREAAVLTNGNSYKLCQQVQTDWL